MSAVVRDEGISKFRGIGSTGANSEQDLQGAQVVRPSYHCRDGGHCCLSGSSLGTCTRIDTSGRHIPAAEQAPRSPVLAAHAGAKKCTKRDSPVSDPPRGSPPRPATRPGAARQAEPQCRQPITSRGIPADLRRPLSQTDLAFVFGFRVVRMWCLSGGCERHWACAGAQMSK